MTTPIPCPFCGETQGFMVTWAEIEDDAMLLCPHCGACGPSVKASPVNVEEDRENATVAWNRRAMFREAVEKAVEIHLNRSNDWHQQRYDRLWRWVKEEVEPLSAEVAGRYYAIVANGSASPFESADWSNTLHGMRLTLDQERARHAREIERARLEAKIEALAKFGECYCDGYDFTCDACLTQERARTALAALEGSK